MVTVNVNEKNKQTNKRTVSQHEDRTGLEQLIVYLASRTYAHPVTITQFKAQDIMTTEAQ
jgi:hypothetical protein